jgi:FKBP-type peptidyl-prolyl cis-trans isomerase (trigger factor)
MKPEIKKLDASEVEIIGEIDATVFEGYRSQAVKRISESVNIKGFRPGHIPENVLAENVGEVTILEEMATLALQKFYPDFVEENKLDVIGRPEISITKMAGGNPLGFKIKSAIAPEFTLPDYRSIAQKVMSEELKTPEVTEKEVDNVIEEIRKSRTQKDAEAPAINDDFAKSIGNFKDLGELRDKIKQNMVLEKTENEKQKRRVEALDKIIAESNISLPRVLIDNESHAMAHEFRNNIESMGIKFDEYLAKTKKTEEDMRKEAEGPATNRVKAKMILHKIAKEEKITVPEEDLNKETEKILEYYKDADRDAARHYAEEIMSNEQVFKFLEDLKIRN